jgi:hypothetical protein
MTKPRKFDEHVPLFAAYAARVASLSPGAWGRLRLSCAALNGPEFRALLERAQLSARPHELAVPAAAERLLSIRAIRAASRAVAVGIGFVYEVVAEFEAAAPGEPTPPPHRRRSTGKRVIDACVDATHMLEAAVSRHERTDPGVATAVRAAGRAVLRHDWMSPEAFHAVYRYVESEIPYAEIDPPANPPPASDPLRTD